MNETMHYAGFLSNFCYVPCLFFCSSRSKKFILHCEELHKFICNALDIKRSESVETSMNYMHTYIRTYIALFVDAG